jgi:hypothetical protein
MTKKFGIRGELNGYPWKDATEQFEEDGIEISIHDGVIEVGYDTATDKERAERLAHLYLNANTLRTGTKITVNFNYSWVENASGGVDHSIELSDQVKVTDRLQIRTNQATITGKARIVSPQDHDSASFTNDTEMVHKALQDTTLEKALGYFAQEVTDDDRPLYGAYKAIEAITEHFGRNGRQQLGSLVGKGKSYVDDLMQTAQHTRHAITSAGKPLTEDECVRRLYRSLLYYLLFFFFNFVLDFFDLGFDTSQLVARNEMVFTVFAIKRLPVVDVFHSANGKSKNLFA